MSEPDPALKGPAPAPPGRREVKWDALAAIIASLVGLLALIVAGYTAYVQRYTAQIQKEQVSAQVWPRLLIIGGNLPGLTSIRVQNQGVGPAIVQSVQILASGKPVTNWFALMKRIGFQSRDPVEINALNKMVLTPGETLPWIKFPNPADIDAFRSDWARFHVQARVCYSSTLGESWVLIYHVYEISVPKPVARCPNVPEKDQFGVSPHPEFRGGSHTTKH
ncbi:MAG: hypothetical protein ACREPK_04795 [Rhodanobacteraceae bacterium]